MIETLFTQNNILLKQVECAHRAQKSDYGIWTLPVSLLSSYSLTH